MISYIRQFFILILLLHIVLAIHGRAVDQRRMLRLFKQRSAENDNEYVWFTRNIHPDMMNDDAARPNLQDIDRPQALPASDPGGDSLPREMQIDQAD